jgi:glycosyltransferase involved in cell wall biosynthesis
MEFEMSTPQSISVVIPCFNGSRYLGATIRSVLAQTAPPMEILVVDDGSTDDSASVAGSFGQAVRIIQQPNQGESVARNRGIDEAKGEWIAFVDADDLWEPGKLAAQLKLASSECACVATGYYTFDEASTQREHLGIHGEEEYSLERLLLEPMIHVSSAMVRREIPVRFPNWTRCGEDMIYFAEMILWGKVRLVPELLTGYRVHRRSQVRSTKGYSLQNLQSRFRWLEEAAPRIGDERRLKLQRLLQEQLVEWIFGARWKRDWAGYWELRSFAAGLSWEKLPAILSERPLPRWVYMAADVIRKMGQKRSGVAVV